MLAPKGATRLSRACACSESLLCVCGGVFFGRDPQGTRRTELTGFPILFYLGYVPLLLVNKGIELYFLQHWKNMAGSSDATCYHSQASIPTFPTLKLFSFFSSRPASSPLMPFFFPPEVHLWGPHSVRIRSPTRSRRSLGPTWANLGQLPRRQKDASEKGGSTQQSPANVGIIIVWLIVHAAQNTELRLPQIPNLPGPSGSQRKEQWGLFFQNPVAWLQGSRASGFQRFCMVLEIWFFGRGFGSCRFRKGGLSSVGKS